MDLHVLFYLYTSLRSLSPDSSLACTWTCTDLNCQLALRWILQQRGIKWLCVILDNSIYFYGD